MIDKNETSNKKDIKFIIIMISFCILFFGGYSEYLYYLTERILMYQIKGFTLTLIGFIFLVYSTKVKNSTLTIISNIAVLAGFVYTFYIVIPLITSTRFEQSGINLGIGFYIHILSFIIFIVSIFVKSNNKVVSVETEVANKYPELNDSDYIIGNILLGFKEIPYKQLSVIKNDQNNKRICIEYKDEETIKEIGIPYNQIKGTKYTPQLIMQQTPNIPADASYEGANELLAFALMGPGLGQIAMTGALDSFVDSYQKSSLKTLFKIEIIFSVDGEERKLAIETSKKPDRFIEKLENNRMC